MPNAYERGWGDPTAKGYRAAHIVGVQVAGLPTLYLRREVARLFLGFLEEIKARGFKFNARNDDWGFAPRPIRGYEQQWQKTHDFHWLSNHAWGLAADLDASDHPLGHRNTGIPAWVVECAHKWGLSWGGDYVNRPDEMHFEMLGTPADVAKYPINHPSAPGAHEEDLLMAVAKDDDDARRCLIRDWCWRYWGSPPSAAEQDTILHTFQSKGADLALAQITDDKKAGVFRAKRGW